MQLTRAEIERLEQQANDFDVPGNAVSEIRNEKKLDLILKILKGKAPERRPQEWRCDYCESACIITQDPDGEGAIHPIRCSDDGKVVTWKKV